MKFKLWIAAAAVLAGLVLMPGTASAHGGSTQCRYFFDTGSEYWGPSQQITQGATILYAVRTMQVCHYLGVERSSPSFWVFWSRINNTAATALVWNGQGQVHGCTVDRDQTFANGRWFSGFNVSCSNN